MTTIMFLITSETLNNLHILFGEQGMYSTVLVVYLISSIFHIHEWVGWVGGWVGGWVRSQYGLMAAANGTFTF